jgi:hypothetical protein
MLISEISASLLVINLNLSIAAFNVAVGSSLTRFNSAIGLTPAWNACTKVACMSVSVVILSVMDLFARRKSSR